MFRLQPESLEDAPEVEGLLDNAFGTGRFSLSSYRLRDAVPPIHELSLVARDEFGALCGTIRFWPINVGKQPALLLGPIAVHPTRQGEGLGAMLMGAGVEKAKRRGWEHILLVGDESYYRQFGFSRAVGVVFPPPTNARRVLLLQNDKVGELSGQVSKWRKPVRGRAPQ